jgi:hypothetical protein
VLDVLVGVGGPKALRAVSAAAKDAEPEVRDAAYRTLGKWTSADAGPELLLLAKASDDSKLQTRALRGYIRVARQFDIPDRQRLAMYREILGLAKRDEEKQLALDVLKQVISAESLGLAVENLDKPALQEAASRVAVSIAQKLVGSQPAAVAKAMEKVLQTTKNNDLSAKATALLEQASKK